VLREGRAHYPISLHGVGLALGSAVGLDHWHLDELAALVAHIDPIRVSDHACFARASYNNQTIHAADLLPIPFSSEALNVMCANVQRVQDRLKRSIAVENLSSYATFEVTCEGSEMPETAFARHTASRSGNRKVVRRMKSQSNTAALTQQQRDLLEAIFTTNNIAIRAINTPSRGIKHPLNSHSARGLQTYQANATAWAQRSLQTAYPVIAQLIGDEAFVHLARDFGAQHPPTRGDLAHWGGELTGFIARIPALRRWDTNCGKTRLKSPWFGGLSVLPV
jgi:Protein of unknown function (DUF692)/Putative DNA-binding domain